MRPENRAVGNLFGREDAIAADRCLNCGAQYTRQQIIMWPNSTQTEYTVSGLCWTCQRGVFEEPSDCTCESPCCYADVGVGVIDCGSLHCVVHGEAARQAIAEVDWIADSTP